MVGSLAESEMLEQHGTKVGGLKPVNVVQAAQADLVRFLHNKIYGEREPFAFHRDDVRKVMGRRGTGTTAQLITLALGRDPDKVNTGKLNTRRLYRDRSLLLDALDLLRAAP